MCNTKSLWFLSIFSSQFKHKRMAPDQDGVNVEISNPIYMKDYEDDENVDEFGLDSDKVIICLPHDLA